MTAAVPLTLAAVAALALAAVAITAVVAALLALLWRPLAIVPRLRPLLARRVAVELPHRQREPK